MESGAKGCEVIVSGKLRGQRAKSMKFVDGFMIHAGNPTREYIDSAVTHVLLRQGVYFANVSIDLLLVSAIPRWANSALDAEPFLFTHLPLSLSIDAGVLGIKVKIMLPHDPTGKSGPKKPLPDQVCLSLWINLHISFIL